MSGIYIKKGVNKGFLWSGVIMGVSRSMLTRMEAIDPFTCLMTITGSVFKTDLRMDNYWIILGVVVMSFLINTGIMIGVAVIVDRKREE